MVEECAGAHPLRFVLITDTTVVPEAELFERVSRMGPGWAVQVRDPQMSARQLLRLATRLRERTREVGAQLLINDRLDIAVAVGADGVHLGRRSVSARTVRRLLGDVVVTASAHTMAEAAHRASEGVDALLFSPVFRSPNKGEPLGPERLTAFRARLPRSVALIALGGVTTGNAELALSAGADGVASIRADLTREPNS